ncbi:MAG: tetratricopeptide repeat protein [Gracilimonas sp.]|jgi:tetratricopeptide (TPR) repeat protein|nr:tetratricopeptide repeat protein [Gracilimonas sp.]
MKVLKQISLVIVAALFTFPVIAQSQADAITAFNKGYEEANSGNYDAAIEAYREALTIANQIGPDGEDVKQKAQNQIPVVQFKKAVSVYQAFQNSRSVEDLNATIAAFEEVVEVGNEFNDERVVPRAKGNIPRLYYTKSVLLFGQENYEAAMEAVDQALNKNPNYPTAYYHKAKIVKKQGDADGDGIMDEMVDEAMQWYDQAIQVADTQGDREIAETAREAAHDELLAIGTRASEAGNIDYALEILNRALNYDDESANVYYRLAEAYNKDSQPESAVEHANKALDFETGGKTDKAKIYYELGYAHQTLGNKSVACDAFTNALYGPFKSPAEHKMEFELKCDSTAP